VGPQLLAGQRSLDGGGAGLDLTPATRPPQCRHQLGMRQRPTALRTRGQAQHRDRVPAASIAPEGGQRRRVESPQGAAHDAGLALAGPGQLLMVSGQHLNRLGQRTVAFWVKETSTP
jgi:hypothetical protein